MLLRSSFHGSRERRKTRRANHNYAGRRSRFESLEDRCLLTTFTVRNLADSGEGSLRAAIQAAEHNPGTDMIDFASAAQGTIVLTSGQLSITDDLTINGPGAEELAVSGSQLSRVFSISGGAIVNIADLTITQGRAVGAPGEGGGILNVSSTLTLDRVVVSNNQAVGGITLADARGAGVANIVGATLTVVDCLFTDNQSLGGPSARGFAAGILNNASNLTVHRSTFVGNQAMGGPGGGPAPGGAISNLMGGATATITDSTFVGNQAIAGDGSGGNGTGRGGGIYNIFATATIENCAFIYNVARGGSNLTGNVTVIGSAIGGGIFSGDAATLLLTGSVIRGNRAIGGDDNTSTGNGFIGAAFGGGMNNVGTATIIDCLFEHNEAQGGSGNRGDGASVQFVGTGNGGGISVNGGDPSGTPITLNAQNATIRHNRAVGGSSNTAGTFIDAGIGGGVANNAGNNNLPVSAGTTVTLLDSAVDHNHAIGGDGGDGLGGGIANLFGGVFNIAGSTFTRNLAQGGDAVAASTGGDGFGGGMYNGATSIHHSNFGAPTVLRIDGSLITSNKANGGTAVSVGNTAGSGAGGGFWNGGTTFVLDTAISHNHALGGDGTAGSDGGNGLGGGVFNDAASLFFLELSTISANHANGGDGGEGGSDGEGIGGGVYNLGDFDNYVLEMIFANYASTSDDDLFDLFA